MQTARHAQISASAAAGHRGVRGVVWADISGYDQDLFKTFLQRECLKRLSDRDDDRPGNLLIGAPAPLRWAACQASRLLCGVRARTLRSLQEVARIDPVEGGHRSPLYKAHAWSPLPAPFCTHDGADG
jgi:hypothetical protein